MALAVPPAKIRSPYQVDELGRLVPPRRAKSLTVIQLSPMVPAVIMSLVTASKFLTTLKSLRKGRRMNGTTSSATSAL
ncbi:hypothetical protein NHJ6243_009463 [Beauveria neobassiana]